MKIDKKEFEFRSHPVIISPYDDIVNKAYHEIQPKPEVDVIKLEPTCSGDRIAWVSNKDLLTGKPGQQRIIHLCLKKIKDKFQKEYGKPFSVTDPQQRQKFKELIKDQLKYVVIPHEMKHIEQEVTHGGEFPSSAESEAEKAEKKRELQMKYLHKKAAVIGVLDNMAGRLESMGHIKYAYALDKISTAMEGIKGIPGGVIEEVKKKMDPQLDYMIGKMIYDARQQGITDPKKLDDFVKTMISRKSLGPYSVRE